MLWSSGEKMEILKRNKANKQLNNNRDRQN